MGNIFFINFTFNQLYIKHKDADGDTYSEIRVPISYGPSQKFLARIEQQANLNKPVQMSLPRMSFEFTGLTYDTSRKVTTTQTFLSAVSADKTKPRKAFMPVPYNMAFELSIMTKLNDDMRLSAAQNNISLHEGVYAWFSGPQFETPAEINAVKVLGAHAVGMSTVPEVILARHQGIRLCALSVITNYAAGMGDTKISHEQTIAFANKAAETVEKILISYLKNQ